jgi:hypothetical protein
MFQAKSLLKHISPAALVLPVLLCCGRVVAQANLALELKEAQATLQASATRITEVEARLANAQKQVNSLAAALASANGDSQQARESYERLRIQMEGLGVAALDSSNSGLQDRLLSALNDMRLLESRNRALATALIDLSQASLDYAKAAAPVDGVPKKELDAKLAQAEKALASLQTEAAPAQESDLLDARVVSLKEDTGIVVFNVGSRHGVHPGMPFSIFRQDKPVARALVVDVRQDVCGAVVQDQVSKDEPVKVGDTGKVDAAKS